MTIQKRIAALVRTGAMLGDYSFTAAGALLLPMHAQIVRLLDGTRLLYYVEAGAEDQHHTHSPIFDTVTVVHGGSLNFSFRGKRSICLAPFSEWPGVSACAMAERLAASFASVTVDDEAYSRFRRFVRACKPVPNAKFLVD